ncbi:fructosamine-3-kinase [Pseudonocardia eucalypti]|uniref:fructosamine kinase family protein n=1 Tax=Pseudonocardia eucalypti TaxID=648755 RepID=UPI001617A4F5|nr:fructosamine-3-kinase [Pseudonocardia eucalypti]
MRPEELPDGTTVVRKRGESGQAAAEAAGLNWLADAGAVPVPRVLGAEDRELVVEYLPPAGPDAAAARRFGAGLARLHAAGAPAFGAPPPGGASEAWIGRAPMRNSPSPDWPDWYAEHRVLRYARRARDAGDLTADECAEVEAACTVLADVAGPPVEPARLHGDLWSGNVLWSRGPAGRGGPGDGRGRVEAWLIDPAAHGGHPETDLAMLALFGCPHLDAVLAGYQAVNPLAPGWPDRVGLHQLFPLLVHVALFGQGYAAGALSAARSVRRLADGIP